MLVRPRPDPIPEQRCQQKGWAPVVKSRRSVPASSPPPHRAAQNRVASPKPPAAKENSKNSLRERQHFAKLYSLDHILTVLIVRHQQEADWTKHMYARPSGPV